MFSFLMFYLNGFTFFKCFTYSFINLFVLLIYVVDFNSFFKMFYLFLFIYLFICFTYLYLVAFNLFF